MTAIVLILVFAFTAEASSRIVGGQEATPGQFPWQGSLQFLSGSLACGCALIGSTKVLTAAHCVGSGAPSYQVVLGLHSMQGGPGGDPEIYLLNSIAVHPDYVDDATRGYPNDVAVITLSEGVNFGNPFIQQIPLAPEDIGDLAGSQCQISGWGRLFGGGPLADNLNYANTEVITNQQCRSRTNPNWVHDGHICIYTGVTGACNGDSGGPMTCSSGGTTFLAGITSWVIGLCDISYPSAYSRVSYFNAWISSQ